MPDSTLGCTLLSIARHAIGEALAIAVPTPDTTAAALQAPGATFVTLTQDGRLRGCIGSLEAWRPLRDDVRANACAAAFRDPRFAPLAAEEFYRTRIEVSLLTPAIPLAFSSEAEALAALRPGFDGVILGCGTRRATFLPQVWEQLPDPKAFIRQLKQKAGLPADYWSPQLTLATYRVDKWKEAQ